MIPLAIPLRSWFLSFKQLSRLPCNANCMNRNKSEGKNANNDESRTL
jgi:hypothetical protein